MKELAELDSDEFGRFLRLVFIDEACTAGALAGKLGAYTPNAFFACRNTSASVGCVSSAI